MRSLQDVRGDFRGCWLWSSGLKMIRYCKPGSNGQGPGLSLDSCGASPSRGLVAKAGSTALGSASALGVLVLPNHPFALGIFPLGACSTFTSPRCPAPAPTGAAVLPKIHAHPRLINQIPEPSLCCVCSFFYPSAYSSHFRDAYPALTSSGFSVLCASIHSFC